MASSGEGALQLPKRVSRVLYLASPVYDYLTDGVFHGLVKLFGRECVVDYPRQSRYHERCSDLIATAKYPMLHFPDKKGNDNGTRPPFGSTYANSFDLVVIGRLHPTTMPVVKQALRYVGVERLVYLDGMDDPYIRGGMCGKVSLYFKRELLRHTVEGFMYRLAKLGMGARENFYWSRNYILNPARNMSSLNALCTPKWNYRRIRPLPFGLVDVGYTPPVTEKRYDVAFIGTLTSPRRQRVLRMLTEWGRRRKLRLLLKVTDRMSWTQYLETLGKALVCVNVRGAGIDTYRYWEIPYSGSLLFSERPIIEIPNNFEDGKHAIFFQMSDMCKRLDELFDNTKEIARLTTAGREHLLRNHTTLARAEELISSWESR